MLLLSSPRPASRKRVRAISLLHDVTRVSRNSRPHAAMCLRRCGPLGMHRTAHLTLFETHRLRRWSPISRQIKSLGLARVRDLPAMERR
ncbi:MAG: hypothetical protein CM15mP18_0410 [Methanobacteriota archaeon]|nr:MAG: hypothetical protein CM15mP18_0410 [Euryarchaeota archaeon]